MSAEDAPRRYVCVHGHFYQPPRENPWLEAVELQPSAHPFHDWNERITAECYAPNSASRILDDQGCIVEIVNNYAWMSFNFGPTLLAWLEPKAPDVYEALLDADRESAARFGGHGSAMAQAYNHAILPLANRRDRETQVTWGIRDFEARFGRFPEGMWLPETAVDTESLEVLAGSGIRFTVLAPNQAARVRPPDGEWRAFDGRRDTGRAYRVVLPSGRDIAVFVYDGPLSRAVAFERLLGDGAEFASRLVGAFDRLEGEAPLSHIATDGETYGHHHRHGEMALSFATRRIARRDDVRLTNYGEYLELHPPTWELEIEEETSWSCAHGVERWRSDCGCSGGRGEDWHQRWRGPLRAALDGLRDDLAPLYEEEAGALLDDPWGARDRYVEVILDRSDESVDAFFEREARGGLAREERVRALRLLETQRHAQLMYTSCGWFFDDIAGIETVQVLRYAGRALQLASDSLGDVEGVEERFLERLAEAPGNLPGASDARDVYRRMVEPSRVDRMKAGAHYAVASLFERYPDTHRIYCFRFERSEERRWTAGQANLLVGSVRVTSLVTRAAEELTYAVLHLGNHNVTGGVRRRRGERAFDDLAEELRGPFERTDFTTVIRVLDRFFQASTYSLRSLFSDAQRRIVDRILEASIEEAETAYARVYQERAPLLRFLADLGIPRPEPFLVAAEYVLDRKLRRILEQESPHIGAITATLDEAASAGVEIEAEGAGYAAQRALERAMDRALAAGAPVHELEGVLEMSQVLAESGLPLTLWKVQNSFFELTRQELGAARERAAAGDQMAQAWVDVVEALAEALRVAV